MQVETKKENKKINKYTGKKLPNLGGLLRKKPKD